MGYTLELGITPCTTEQQARKIVQAVIDALGYKLDGEIGRYTP